MADLEPWDTDYEGSDNSNAKQTELEPWDTDYEGSDNDETHNDEDTDNSNTDNEEIEPEHDVLEFNLHKIKYDIIINGYIRRYNTDKIDNWIPLDIINLLIRFYQLPKDKFQHYDNKYFTLSNHDLIATKKGDWETDATIYGHLCIPSLSKTKHEWIFKIHKTKGFKVGIGIDSTEYYRKNNSFLKSHNRTKLYGILCDGRVIRWDRVHTHNISNTKLRFESGDIVIMDLDLISDRDYGILSYRINNGKKMFVVMDVVRRNGIKYCMAVCCGWSNECVELISYSKVQI